MKPAVCVIVPVYKAVHTLDRCVESILTQEVPGGLSCILVDDGSPDESGAMCDAWAAKDSRVRVIHQEDGGVSSARNAGLELADAEYIVFLDSDDALREGALEAALSVQQEHPGSFVIWHYTTDLLDDAPTQGEVALRPASALARLYLDCLIAMPWNKLYRGDLLRQLRFDESYTLGEDLQFVLDYIVCLNKERTNWNFTVLDAPLTWYNCDTTGTSLSTRYHDDYCDIWPRHFAKLNAACHAPAPGGAHRPGRGRGGHSAAGPVPCRAAPGQGRQGAVRDLAAGTAENHAPGEKLFRLLSAGVVAQPASAVLHGGSQAPEQAAVRQGGLAGLLPVPGPPPQRVTFPSCPPYAVFWDAAWQTLAGKAFPCYPRCCPVLRQTPLHGVF